MNTWCMEESFKDTFSKPIRNSWIRKHGVWKGVAFLEHLLFQTFPVLEVPIGLFYLKVSLDFRSWEVSRRHSLVFFLPGMASSVVIHQGIGGGGRCGLLMEVWQSEVPVKVSFFCSIAARFKMLRMPRRWRSWKMGTFWWQCVGGVAVKVPFFVLTAGLNLLVL